jgi:hypothetical protein
VVEELHRNLDEYVLSEEQRNWEQKRIRGHCHKGLHNQFHTAGRVLQHIPAAQHRSFEHI